MLLVALAVGVAVGAADDDAEWRSRDQKKSTPVRSLADDWDDDAPSAKRSSKAVRPSLRQIGMKPTDEPADASQWRSPGAAKEGAKKKASTSIPIKPTSGPDASEQRVVKADVVAEMELDDLLPLLQDSKPLPKPVVVQSPPEASSQSLAGKLPELPKGLKTNQKPAKSPTEVGAGPNEPPTNSGPEATKIIEKPPIGAPSPTELPPSAPRLTTPPTATKELEKTAPPRVVAPWPDPIVPPPMQAVPKIAPGATTKVDRAPAPKVLVETPPPTPGTTAAWPPVLTEHGAFEDSTNICMPLMDAASAWKTESRSFLLWWDQPGGDAFVRNTITGQGLVGGGDFDFEKQFGQQISIERRFDAATALVVSGFMTEDARQSAGVVEFGGLGLNISGPGSAAFTRFSGFRGRATSRLWKVDVDFAQHFLREPDSPIRGRIFFGPQFIGLHETFEYQAQGVAGNVAFDARTVNTLFGADAGFGATFQPWYSNLGIDVSGRYGVFGNVFDHRNAFGGLPAAFSGLREESDSRFASALEFNVEATLRVARNLCLLAGWRLWNLQGVGRAASQVPANTLNSSLPISTNGNLFAHGVFLGAALGWGGAADPNCRYGGARPYILREP